MILDNKTVANSKVVGGFTRKADTKDSFWTLYIKNEDGTKEPILKATLVDLWGKTLSPKVANEMGLEQFADKDIWNDESLSEAVLSKTNTQHYFNLVASSIKEFGFMETAWAMTGDLEYLHKAVKEASSSEYLCEWDPETGLSKDN